MPVTCALGSAAGGRGTRNERRFGRMDKETKKAFQDMVGKLDKALDQQAKSVLVIKKLFSDHNSNISDLKSIVANQPDLTDIKKLLED
jgi:hypothetical protein